MPQPQYTNNGGFRTAAIYSGIIAGPSLAAAPGAVAAGSDTLLFSGAGRLNRIQPHVGLQSGVAVVLYDAAVAASGGPIVSSGHIVIGVVPPMTGLSGTLTLTNPIEVNIPFNSGLCVATRSGCPGFTVSWTPEKPQ